MGHFIKIVKAFFEKTSTFRCLTGSWMHLCQDIFWCFPMKSRPNDVLGMKMLRAFNGRRVFMDFFGNADIPRLNITKTFKPKFMPLCYASRPKYTTWLFIHYLSDSHAVLKKSEIHNVNTSVLFHMIFRFKSY